MDGSGNDKGGIIDFYDAASKYTNGHRPSSCGSKTITRFKYRFKYRGTSTHHTTFVRA